MIRRTLVGTALALILVSLTLVPAPVTAAGTVNLYISVNPTSVVAGEWASVSGVLVNNSTSKLRTTVTFTAYDTCGTKIDLGYNRVVLAPGQSVLITTAYPTSANACRGANTVTMTLGGKNGSSASTTLEVL
jgi:hypothetical protein